MEIIQYNSYYKSQIISLILDIQNCESKLDLKIDDQLDLLDINKSYIRNGGNFWLAIDNNIVIGTIGMIIKDDSCAILKKFFVKKEYRNQKVGLKLYLTLLEFAQKHKIKFLVLDTPAIATKSHKFYEKNGFKEILEKDLPIKYDYPDRNSKIYVLSL